MVYYGPSQGCYSCKARRKKCDGTRPSCMRCTKAGRGCGGYEEVTHSNFRRHLIPNAALPPPFESSARKCSLPIHLPIPGTGILPVETLPREVSYEEGNNLALRSFYYDYCATSANSNLSRGFLSRLEIMVRRLGPKSDLARACQAVALSSAGKRLQRPTLLHRAETFHQDLLGSLAKSIQSPNPTKIVESRLIAMMLGLFQIIIASDVDHGSHNTHARGLAALMEIGQLPLIFLDNTRLLKTLDPNLKHHLSRIISIPALSEPGESLDDLLVCLNALWGKSESKCKTDNALALKTESINLNLRFECWQNSRKAEFKPIIAGQVTQSCQGAEIAVGFWPVKVHTYFDNYVAGVWNIVHAARLLLISLIVRSAGELHDNVSRDDYICTAHGIAEDLISSIPYHLANNLQDFLSQQATTTEFEVGKSLRGLLLMHPLYVATETAILPEEMRQYMRECLAWIGLNMGIGQADLLAKTPEINREYLASGCMIIWSGFLV